MAGFRNLAVALLVAGLPVAALAAPDYSVVIRGGTIFDGSGDQPIVGDVALKGDKIVYVGPNAPGEAARTVDASGKAWSS